MKKFLLAIPCFNCAKQVKRVLDTLDHQSLAKFTCILFVDNHSTDGTAQVIKAELERMNSSRFKLFVNENNYGLGGSFKIILNFAHQNFFDYVVFLHGDDQAKIKDALQMINMAEKDPSLDIIYGARFMKESILINYSWQREWGNRALNAFFSLILKKHIYEIGSGLNIYKVSSLPLEVVAGFPHHLAFDIDLLLYSIERSLNIKFFPITWEEKDQVSNARNLKVGLTVLWRLWHWKIQGIRKSSEFPALPVERMY